MDEKKIEIFYLSRKDLCCHDFFLSWRDCVEWEKWWRAKGKENNQNFITAENYILFLSLLYIERDALFCYWGKSYAITLIEWRGKRGHLGRGNEVLLFEDAKFNFKLSASSLSLKSTKNQIQNTKCLKSQNLSSQFQVCIIKTQTMLIMRWWNAELS